MATNRQQKGIVEPTIRFRTVTLNTWLLPYKLTPHTDERTSAITQELHRLQPDVVCFQEVWSHKHAEFIRKAGKHQGLVFDYGDPSTGGMLILTKFPMDRKEFIPFRNTGFPAHVSSGEFLSRKGILRARLITPAGKIYVQSLHLLANYSQVANETLSQDVNKDEHEQGHKDVYHGKRAAQLAELLVNDHALGTSTNKHLGDVLWSESEQSDTEGDPTDPVILLGDFNMEPNDPALQAYLKLSGFLDGSAISTPSATEAFGASFLQEGGGQNTGTDHTEQSKRIARNAYNAADNVQNFPKESRVHPATATIHTVYSPYSAHEIPAAKVDYTLFRPGAHLVFPTRSRLAFTKSWKLPRERLPKRALQSSSQATDGTANSVVESRGSQLHENHVHDAYKTSCPAQRSVNNSGDPNYTQYPMRLEVEDTSAQPSFIQRVFEALGGQLRERLSLLRHKADSSSKNKLVSYSDHVGIVTDFCLSPCEKTVDVEDRSAPTHLHAIDDGVTETELIQRLISVRYSPFAPFPCSPFSNTQGPPTNSDDEPVDHLQTCIDHGLQECRNRRNYYLFQAGASAFSTVIAARMLHRVQNRTVDPAEPEETTTDSNRRKVARRAKPTPRGVSERVSSVPSFKPAGTNAPQQTNTGPLLFGRGPRLALRFGRVCLAGGVCLTLGYSVLGANTYWEEASLRNAKVALSQLYSRSSG